MMKKNLIYSGSHKIRLDIYLTKELSISRNQVHSLINNCAIQVNQQAIKPSYLLETNDQIIINSSNISKIAKFTKNLNEYCDLIFEDNDLLLVNKHKGIVTNQESVNNNTISLENILKYHFQNESFTDSLSAVHRLDKDTSGLVLFAKNPDIKKLLQEQFKERSVLKKYYALVWGNFIENKILLSLPLQRSKYNPIKMVVNEEGRIAETSLEVLKRYPNFTLLSLTLHTGRTHQLRAHLNFINHSIIGDPVYYKQHKPLLHESQFLHAYYLKFQHPVSHQKMVFKTKIPEYFLKKIQNLLNN